MTPMLLMTACGDTCAPRERAVSAAEGPVSAASSITPGSPPAHGSRARSAAATAATDSGGSGGAETGMLGEAEVVKVGVEARGGTAAEEPPTLPLEPEPLARELRPAAADPEKSPPVLSFS
jgi:hypothetical protein